MYCTIIDVVHLNPSSYFNFNNAYSFVKGFGSKVITYTTKIAHSFIETFGKGSPWQ